MAVFVGCRDTRTVSDGRQTKKHCIAMLFRLTADNVGRCVVGADNVGRQT